MSPQAIQGLVPTHVLDETEDDVQLAPLYFLQRSPLWDTIKPYNFHYLPKEHCALHNLLRMPNTVRIENMRRLNPAPSLETQGFAIAQLGTAMNMSDFESEGRVQEIYMRELETYFLKYFQANAIRALDFQVRVESSYSCSTRPIGLIAQLRRRDPSFPYFGEKPEFRPQPSLMTHIDVTPGAAEAIVRELYGDEAETILKQRYQIITVWRPLRTPVMDWPLAICDATSTDPEDFIETDVIYPNYVAENFMIHFNEGQRWYWLPNQTSDEVLVFKAVDSDPTRSSSCPHGAFPLKGQNGACARRESIDVRLLVMYADLEHHDINPSSVTAT